MRCEIANAGCEQQTTCKCFSCGAAACRRDSMRLPYGRYGVKRICVRCIEDHDRELGHTIVDEWYQWLDSGVRTRRDKDEYRPELLSVPKAYGLRP